MKKRVTAKKSLEVDASLIGVVSQLPDYRLAHFINKHTDCRLVKEADLVMGAETPGEGARYPFFIGHNQDYGFDMCMVANRFADMPLLIPGLRNIDYLMLLFELTPQYDLNALIKSIREIPRVILVQGMERPKGAEACLAAIELHITRIKMEDS